MLLTLCPSSVGYAFMNFGDVSVFAGPTSIAFPFRRILFTNIIYSPLTL